MASNRERLQCQTSDSVSLQRCCSEMWDYHDSTNCLLILRSASSVFTGRRIFGDNQPIESEIWHKHLMMWGRELVQPSVTTTSSPPNVRSPRQGVIADSNPISQINPVTPSDISIVFLGTISATCKSSSSGCAFASDKRLCGGKTAAHPDLIARRDGCSKWLRAARTRMDGKLWERKWRYAV